MGKKISELTLPSLPLAGTELIEMSQSGVSVKVTADELQTDVLGGIGSFDGTAFTVVGDIVANDITTSGSSLYIGETPIKEVSENEIQIGDPELNSREAILHLRGDNSDRGGRMRLYLGAAENTTITYYEFYQTGDDLRIGPNIDGSAIQYSPGVVDSLPRSLRIGASQGAAFPKDVVVEIGNNTTSVLRGEGTLKVHGAGAGFSEGGIVQVYTASDYDTGIDYYQMAAYEDDLYIGSVNDPDSFKLDGNDNSWNFTHGDLNVGVDNNTKGELSVYGDQASQGGETRLYTGAAYDTTIDYYRFAAGNGDSDLTIGPITDGDALVYNATLNRWQAAATGGFSIGDPTTASGSSLYVGVDDVGPNARVHIYGGNSAPGGSLYLYTGEPYDTTIDHYLFATNEDDLEIGPVTDEDALKYDGGTNTWNFTAGALNVGVDDTTQGHIKIYGAAVDDGGRIDFYLAANDDPYGDFHTIKADEQGLKVLRDNSEVLMFFDEDSSKLHVYDSFIVEDQYAEFGIANTLHSRIDVYGTATGSTIGGRIRLHTSFDESVISNFDFNVVSDDLTIGPDTNPDALKYDGATNTWVFSRNIIVDERDIYLQDSGTTVIELDTGAPRIRVGVNDVLQGQLYLYSDAAGGGGGEIRLYVSADEVGIDNYRIEADEDDLKIGPNTNSDALKYDGGLNQWQFSASGGTTMDGVFRTDSTGIVVIGDIHCDDLYTSGDTIYVGTGQIKSTSGNVELHYDGTKVFETTAAGVSITDAEFYWNTNFYMDINSMAAQLHIRVIPGGGALGDAIVIDPQSATTIYHPTGGGSVGMFTTNGGIKVPEGVFHVGTNDSDAGGIIIWGGGNGEAGGRLIIATPADYDDNIESYHFEVLAGTADLDIGPDTDPDSLKYDSGNNDWNFTGGSLNVGVDDVTKGLVSIYGSASENGGELRFYNPADYDSTNEYWNFDLVEDEFSLNASGGKTLATFYGGGSMELGTAAGQIDIFGNIVLVSPQKVELNAQTKILYKRPSSDLTGSGEVISTTVDQNTRGVAGCLAMGSDGNWDDADSTAEVSVGFLVMAVEVGTGTKDVMLKGFMQDDSWSWTPSDKLFVGSFGEITNIEPGSGEYRQVVGYAFSSTEIYFNPSMDYTLVP